MKVASLEAFTVELPFRFAFAHNLASRSSSTSLIVRVHLDSGDSGYGEGIPRLYVTGEDIDSAAQTVLEKYAPLIKELEADSVLAAASTLHGWWQELGLDSRPSGAAWCAVELAVLDAFGRAENTSLAQALGPPRCQAARYGAVVPFCSRKAFTAILGFYRLYGFKTVKLKVGRDLPDDIARVRLARRILGSEVRLRIDANCAWSVLEAIRAADAFRPFGVISYEQPVAADDLEALSRVTAAIPEDVIADESVNSRARARQLAESRACDGFNIRLSKAGGILAARDTYDIAREYGLKCLLGAQVGESGVLSAAGRTFACLVEQLENCEGSANSFLLQQDVTYENMTVGPGGLGRLSASPGLGVRIVEKHLVSAAGSSPVEPCRAASPGAV